MSGLKILVITPQYAPDFGPSVPIYTSLCEDLAHIGYDVNVITGFPHNAGSEVYYKQNNRIFAEEHRNGVRVIRTFVYKVPKISLWRRLLYHASFNLSSTIASFRISNPDIVLADAPTLWSGLPLLVRCIIPGVPFIYIVHDIYPDVLVRLGILNNTKLIELIEKLEQFFYNRSAQISVLSVGFKENLLHKGLPDDKITIIPACVDAEFIKPLPKVNKLYHKWDINGKFVVLYAGNMGLSQSLETVLNAAQQLQDHEDIMFLFVGDGATKPKLEIMVHNNNLTNVRFYPFQPREDVSMVYALADVCLVSLRRDIVVESVPSKSYTIMASGRPILATVNEDTETGHLIKKSHSGYCVEPENPEVLKNAILQLYENKPLRDEMGKNGRNYILENFSRQVATHLYKSAIQQFYKPTRQ